jgi:hypothetical protein
VGISQDTQKVLAGTDHSGAAATGCTHRTVAGISGSTVYLYVVLKLAQPGKDIFATEAHGNISCKAFIFLWILWLLNLL